MQNSDSFQIPAEEQILDSEKLIRPFIHKTPVMHSMSLNELTGSRISFKCENFQKTGSFKIRGAMNAVLRLSDDELSRGVITHSSGNFAQALAYAAKCKGIRSTIIMPENVLPVKRDAVLGYGAEIVYSGSDPRDRETKCEEVRGRTGASFIHPSNDLNVITGHSSCAIELTAEIKELDYVFCPVGGGGLLSGIALGFLYFSPHTKIIAAEPLNANDAFLSMQEGKIHPQENPDTIADGLKTTLGSNTFPIIQKLVSRIVTVTEEEIISAMRMIWERMKIIAEPSSAVAFAALLSSAGEIRGKKCAVILSGGNVDLNNLPFNNREKS